MRMASQPATAANFAAYADTAWLFVRGFESVLITRSPLRGANYELLIEGPHDSEQRLTFSDLVACVEKQMEVEYTLLVRGFHLEKLTADPEFKGVISDIGGATANMYEMRCTRPEVEAKCKRLSCVHPTICKLLGTDHGPLIQLMREVRETPGIGDFTGSAGKPTPMNPRDVERILHLGKSTDEGDTHVKTAIPFRAGDRVRVKEGYFQNFEGDVESVDEANGRVTVMINIFGRSTPVELEHWQIEAV